LCAASSVRESGSGVAERVRVASSMPQRLTALSERGLRRALVAEHSQATNPFTSISANIKQGRAEQEARYPRERKVVKTIPATASVLCVSSRSACGSRAYDRDRVSECVAARESSLSESCFRTWQARRRSTSFSRFEIALAETRRRGVFVFLGIAPAPRCGRVVVVDPSRQACDGVIGELYG
jgi:hypothetical protein